MIEPNGSNPIVNLSGAVENVLRSILYNLGLDTPNEKLHGLVYYSLALKEQGFVNIETNFPCLTGLPPLPPLCLKIGVVRFISLVPIHIGVRLRYMLLRITDSILSFPLAGANMLILGMKSSTVNENALKSRFNDCTRGK